MAIAWRDQMMAMAEPLLMADFHAQKRSNNVSGVPGVHFHITKAQPHGFWQATIKIQNGTRNAKSFSVRKHGNDEAFRLAVEARNRMLELVKDQPYLYHPDAKKAVQPPAAAASKLFNAEAPNGNN